MKRLKSKSWIWNLKGGGYLKGVSTSGNKNSLLLKKTVLVHLNNEFCFLTRCLQNLFIWSFQ